jgi:hypothetical protein
VPKRFSNFVSYSCPATCDFVVFKMGMTDRLSPFANNVLPFALNLRWSSPYSQIICDFTSGSSDHVAAPLTPQREGSRPFETPAWPALRKRQKNFYGSFDEREIKYARLERGA